MHLVLVDNFIMPDTLDPTLFDVHPHLGLTSLAAVAQQEDHDVSIYDPKREVRFGRHPYDGQLYHRCAEDILRSAPDVVGFTTLGCSFLFATNVAGIIREAAPDLPILLGGPHATMLDRAILETYQQFDVVVRYEAEDTLVPVLGALETRRFDAIPAITWRDVNGAIRATPGSPKIEDLDRLPIPAYDLYPVAELELELMRVEAGRGCPFVCTFCSTASFFQRDYRLKSPERLVHEMDLLHQRYGVREFKLDHDLFTVNRRKVRAFCDAVVDRDYRWRVSARTDCVDAELLAKMALAGCVGLYFGIETGSQRMQKIADKRLKLQGVDQILDTAENLGIETTVSFITGYPEEEARDQNETLDMLGRCFGRPQDACTPQLHILLPEPGTPMFAEHQKHLAYDGYATKFNARLLGTSDRQHVLGHPELYSTYHYYPAAMPRATYTFAVDAVDVLRTAGHETLSYALRFFGGRLSELIARFREWHRRQPTGPAVDTNLALAFVADSFGPDHHVTSLFRFGFMISTRRRSAAPRASRTGKLAALRVDRQLCYCVNPQTCVFTDLHDCADLLERIRALPPGTRTLDEAKLGERHCYMTIVDADRWTHYYVEPGIESILTLFETPQRLRDVLAFLREIAPDAPLDEDLFGELIAIGALIPAGDERSPLGALS
jgi:radical SAM superfamily enzyme YgiQ (UPF0313 family)